MQTAKPEITEEFALVDQDIQEILTSKDVDQVRIFQTNLKVDRKYFQHYFDYLVPPPEPDNTECKVDAECPALEICYTSGGSNQCVDPCSTIRPCVLNAECNVFSTTPTRTMTCTCFEGYTGNGVVRCDKISKFVKTRKNVLFGNFFKKVFILIAAPIEIGCSSDVECLSSQACRNRACVNPCSFDDPCSSTAQCSVTNHKAECRCPPGLTGDPYSLCVPRKIDIKLTLIGHF